MKYISYRFSYSPHPLKVSCLNNIHHQLHSIRQSHRQDQADQTEGN
jgi:hypothetical protein